MFLPRFKEVNIGFCPALGSSIEYDECVKSNTRRNRIKRFINKLLDLIDRNDNVLG